MKDFDDAILMAFVDGELNPAQAYDVQRAIQKDAELMTRVESFRASTALAASAFSTVLQEPIPLRLARTIVGTGGGSKFAMPLTAYRITAAASLAALLLGAGGGYGVAGYWQLREQRNLERAAASERDSVGHVVQGALEKQVSGTSVEWRDPDTAETIAIEPVRTFRNQEGRYCREYREADTQRDGAIAIRYGLACRYADGAWKVRYYLVPGDDPPGILRK